MTRSFIAALVLLVSCVLCAPAGSATHSHGPETARELRRERAEKNLERNRRNLEREAMNAELPPVDETLVEEYTRLITYLADPAREGRAPGSQGIEDAAVFIEHEMQRIGLSPAFDQTETDADGEEVVTPDSTFRQHMPLGSTLSATTQTMTINGVELTAGEDFQPLAYSGSESVSGPVVFTGYAVVSGPNGYLGFGAGDSLKDKVALCLKYEPMDEHGDSKWREEDGWSHHSRLTYKVSALERRGASAVLIVAPESANDASAGMLDSIESTSPPSAMGAGNGPKFDIPVLSITPEAAQMIVDMDGSGRRFADLVSRANEKGIVEDLDDATVAVDVKIERAPTYTDNIGGILRGRGDLAGEYIVIGGHYDHVGYGHFGSRSRSKNVIHPGADDNASGTSGMLLAAEQLSARYALMSDTESARSVLFLAFTAEESGLNGSKYYVEHPIVDLDEHAIMLNMDMIGRLEADPLEIGGYESSDELAELATHYLDESGMVYDRDTSVGSGRSDHASFEAKKIPNMFFFTGLHDEYHTPEDTLDLVDMTGAVRIATVVSQIAYDAATTHTPFIHERNRNVADSRRDDENRQPTVRIGIIPVNAADGGLFVQRVFDNTSASNAGLKANDRITSWDGELITSVEAWSPKLLEHKPGDVVELTVVRDGETMEMEMTLKGLE